MTKIAVIVGSSREGSYNLSLAKLAAKALEAEGGIVSLVQLAAWDLPIYSEHLEQQNFPANALKLKLLFQEQAGLLFVSPEYNGSVTPLLKNAIDWASRPTDGEGPTALTAYRGKASAIMSVSLSPFGGLRGLLHLRQILGTIQTIVIPEQVALPNAHLAFDDIGNLREALPASLVEMTARRLVAVSEALDS